MDNKKLPKVLAVTTNAWRDNTNINTLIEFFKCWDKDRIAQIYTKSALPKTTVCNCFFRISENAVIKSIFNRKIKTGSIVENETVVSHTDKQAAEKEKRLYSHSGNLFLNVCREFVWKFGRWKTKELDDFIGNFDADVIFLTIYPTIYMARIQKYIIKKTQKPIVSYIADDNYTYKPAGKNLIKLLSRAILRKYVKYIVDNSSKLMVISPKQKKEYDEIFGTDSQIMTKGCDFSLTHFESRTVNDPIKMVYTGKLIIGRWKSLARIADALGEINKERKRVELDIYTTDTLTNKQHKALCRNGCSVKGALTFDEVKRVQKEADILVFVESLESKHKYAARLSFSTKIVDYFLAGKCIFAIGDKDIAPIDYFNKYDCAVTATSYEEIVEKLKALVSNTSMVVEYGKKGYECGKENHNIDLMNKTLMDAINSSVKDTTTQTG